MAAPDDRSVIVAQLSDAVRKKIPGASDVELDSIVSDVRVNTTTSGASTLEIDVIDPDWALTTSGFLDIGDDQKFDTVDINYPKGSNHWWRLTQGAPSTSLSAANLILTFEARAVSYCRLKTGTKSWSRAQYTRAQAIKAMTVDEVKASPKLIFVSPELTERQPVAVPA